MSAKGKRSTSITSNEDNSSQEKDGKREECIERKENLKTNYVYQYINKTIKISFSLYGVYLVWIVLHYGASHLYIEYCVPRTWIGALVSPFLTSTPHCQGLRWLIYNGGNQINNMWVTIGSWVCMKLII
jgi:hypothetical protein